ncbi:hypothetical protein ABGB18_38755 [Nonomuraea sp. B12E4]|uniref:hypothetical protein n=1 Tax=Nonomuraea sp. B12E4 TaxID=3153564 RepID=UPI00325E14D5
MASPCGAEPGDLGRPAPMGPAHARAVLATVVAGHVAQATTASTNPRTTVLSYRG